MKHQRVTVSLDDSQHPRAGVISDTSPLGAGLRDFEDASIFRETLASLRLRWRGLTIWVLFCVAIALAYVLLATPQFVSTTQVVLEPREPEVPVDPAASSTAPTLDSAQADSQVQVIQSERNLRYVFDTLDIANDPIFAASGFDPIGWIQTRLAAFTATPTSPEDAANRSRELAYQAFADRLTVKRLAQSYAFEISFRAPSAKKAASLVNSITVAYIRDQVIYNVAAAAAQRGGDYLQNRISDSKTEQDVATNAVKAGIVPDYTFGHADARIVSAGLEPLNKSYPMTTLILALAVVFAAASGVGAVIVSEGLNRTVRSREQLLRLTGIRALEIVAGLSRKGRSGESLSLQEALDAPGSQFAKVMRRLRASVLTTASHSRHVSIGVVSCHAGEGRSTVASNLAHAIAASGPSVTLLDADSRNPSLTNALAPAAVRGLSELLEDHGADAVGSQLPINANLSFIPASGAGRDHDPSLYLGSSEMLATIDALTEERELIVDLPPLSVSADAIELGRLLTGVIVVVAVRRTTIDELADLLRTLHAGNVRVIEVLLNEPVSKS